MRKNKYLFVYGSLVNPSEVVRTLGHPAKTVHPVRLDGWIREWGVAIDYSVSRQRLLSIENTDSFSYVAALNVRPAEHGERATDPNGVLIEVSDDDLTKLDARESHYTLTDVTEHIVGAPEGLIYTYSGKEQFHVARLNQDAVAIPESYATLVLDSFSTLGDDMRTQYLQTTSPATLPMRASVFGELIDEAPVDTDYFQPAMYEKNLEPALG